MSNVDDFAKLMVIFVEVKREKRLKMISNGG